jgi:hypothetical protein
MGQQQLLLIILGVIVVGIAVAVGISMFKDNAVSANRDAVTNDLINLAARAQQYYRRPTALGGGQGSFSGLTADISGLRKITSIPNGQNANGIYSIVTSGVSSMVIQGLGTETGNDQTTPVKVVMNVWADSAKVDPNQGN